MGKYTTVRFSDIGKADNFSAEFWVNLQKEFTAVKAMDRGELMAYCLDLIAHNATLVNKSIKKIMNNEHLGQCAGKSVYTKIQKASEISALIDNKRAPTLDDLSSLLKSPLPAKVTGFMTKRVYVSDYLQKILTIRDIAGENKHDEKINLMKAALSSPTVHILYQIATLLTFIKETESKDLMDEYRQVLMDALENYNNVAASAGEARLFVTDTDGELEDDKKEMSREENYSPAKPK